MCIEIVCVTNRCGLFKAPAVYSRSLTSLEGGLSKKSSIGEADPYQAVHLNLRSQLDSDVRKRDDIESQYNPTLDRVTFKAYIAPFHVSPLLANRPIC